MKTLYEINQEYLKAIDTAFEVDEETGEIIFDEDIIEALNLEFNEKVDNTVCVIKHLQGLSDSIKAEKQALDERMKAVDKQIDRLKEYVSASLKMRDMNKFESARNKLSFRTSKKVEVLNESVIPEEYFKTEEVKKLDKKTILKELKEGKQIEGCFLKENSNLQIK